MSGQPNISEFFGTGSLSTLEKDVILKGYGLGKARREGRTYTASELAQLHGTSSDQVRKSEMAALSKLKKDTEILGFLVAQEELDKATPESSKLKAAIEAFNPEDQKPIIFAEEDNGGSGTGDTGGESSGDNPRSDAQTESGGTEVGTDVGSGSTRVEPVGQNPSVDSETAKSDSANGNTNSGVSNRNQVTVRPIYGLTPSDIEKAFQGSTVGEDSPQVLTSIIYDEVRRRPSVYALAITGVKVNQGLSGTITNTKMIQETNFGRFAAALEEHLATAGTEFSISFMSIFVSTFQRAEFTAVVLAR